jgi:hypothetical protein
LYGYENWSFKFRDEYWLKKFEKKDAADVTRE